MPKIPRACFSLLPTVARQPTALQIQGEKSTSKGPQPMLGKGAKDVPNPWGRDSKFTPNVFSRLRPRENKNDGYNFFFVTKSGQCQWKAMGRIRSATEKWLKENECGT